MNHAQSHALAEFVHDHDKRFAAAPEGAGDSSTVLLTLVADGAPLPLVGSWDDYEAAYIDADNPGPTVREAWKAWRARQG